MNGECDYGQLEAEQQQQQQQREEGKGVEIEEDEHDINKRGEWMRVKKTNKSKDDR